MCSGAKGWRCWMAVLDQLREGNFEGMMHAIELMQQHSLTTARVSALSHAQRPTTRCEMSGSFCQGLYRRRCPLHRRMVAVGAETILSL